MSLPKLAIVGRPNVGKSALFNRICKKRIAIVDEAEGITRDRLYATTDLFGRPFEVIDTGGIDPRSKAPFNEQIKQQAEIAIEEADTLVMVVDCQVGITHLDQEIAHILLKTKKPLTLAVNKVDSPEKESVMYDFLPLGIEQIVAISAEQNWHVAELLEVAIDPLPIQEAPEKDPSIQLSIVGRPNVGKSSLVNHLLDETRCVVSPIPGTTRDSIDVPFIWEDTSFTLIDTAGIRRKHAEHEVVDKFASVRTERAIERSDVCLLMLDAREGMSSQDKRIAAHIRDNEKGCVLVFNKWDLVKGFRMEHCLQDLEEELSFLNHCPKIFTSVETGRNLDKIFPAVKDVYESGKKRITTHQLNKFVEGAMQRVHPPMIKGKRLRIYYMAQVGTEPPRFVLFVNHPHLMADSYMRYLYNQFREEYQFTGVPIVFHMKGKKVTERPHKSSAPEFQHKSELVDDDDDDYQ